MKPHTWSSSFPMQSRRLALTLGAAALFAATAAQSQVGMSQMQVGPMPVTLVYPTAATSRPFTSGDFTINVALGATPIRGNGRLIVMSHGTGGSAIAGHDLAATLVRAGFVVAQPEHDGDNWRDQRLAGPESWKLRPIEISRTIDAVAQDARFAGLLDVSKVGVHGMSAGGVSGLSLAGGEWSLDGLILHCKAHMATDPIFCFTGTRTPEQRAQRKAGYDNAPDTGVDPTPHGGARVRDPRVAAIALAVPLAAPYSTASLSRLHTPVGIVEATDDVVLVPRFHAARVLQHCKSCTVIDRLEGADHFDVLSPWPESVARDVGRLFGGGNKGIPRPRLMQSYERVSTFFKVQLKVSP